MNRLSALFLFGILMSSFGAWGQFNSDGTSLKKKENVFKDGEWFQFRIHYGFFNASYVTLGLETDTINGVPVFHAKG